MDDKKIDAAAYRFATSQQHGELLALIDGYKEGYKDAIREFLKNLWHPASEKPNIKQGECCVTCLVKFKNGSTELCVYFRNPEGWVCDDMSPKDFKRNFKGWLYIDDLFPKKKDKQ